MLTFLRTLHHWWRTAGITACLNLDNEELYGEL